MVMVVMASLEMGSLSFNQQINHGIMADHHGHGDGHHSNLPYSDDISSSESDLTEDGSVSSGSSSPARPEKGGNGALGDMSSLLQQLPIKRGLSKYFNGKSQSYSSLSNVTCLEDLAKPENPYNKKLKSCKSYMCFSDAQKSPPNVLKSSSSSKLISKKSSSSRSSCSSSMASSKRNVNSGFVGNNNSGMNMKPPPHPTPLRSSSTSSFNNCTPLFV